MTSHNSYESTRRFLAGELVEAQELRHFETHLLECDECWDSVREVIRILQADGRGQLPRSRRKMEPKFKGCSGEYHQVEAVLTDFNIQQIGILLVAGTDRLYFRFRRDIEALGAGQKDWLKQLPDLLTKKARELDGARCLQWLRSSYPITLRISPGEKLVIQDSAAETVDAIYKKHIHPNVLPFVTHLPQYTLEGAAGKFGREMAVAPEGWVEIWEAVPFTKDMFVIQLEEDSMEPQIPEGGLCVFRHNISGSWDRKVLLIELYGKSGSSRYTIKRCHIARPVQEGAQTGDDQWPERVILHSINPKYESWEIGSAENVKALGEFLFAV